MKYNPKIVLAYFREVCVPKPLLEYKFSMERNWRFDFAWPDKQVYLEVQGGIWIRGGHSRGAGMKKDWEKFNAATVMGWRPLFVEPRDLCMDDTANMIKTALGVYET